MASRPQLQPYPVITNGSLAGNLTSLATILSDVSMISYSISWTGTSPVGSIIVEVSNDYSQNVDGSVKNAGQWTAIPLSATTDISGNVDHGFIDIDANAGYAIRLRYARTSGTGVMNALVKCKVA